MKADIKERKQEALKDIQLALDTLKVIFDKEDEVINNIPASDKISHTKELHVWLDSIGCTGNPPVQCTFVGTEEEINRGAQIIHTTQPHFFSTKYIHTYELYAHKDGKMIHVQLGSNNPSTLRDIKEGHSLENLLLSGEFDFDNPYK